MSTRTYGDGSCDNVFRHTARPTAGMHAAVKPETDAQLHARLTAAVREGYNATATVRVSSDDSAEFLAECTFKPVVTPQRVLVCHATAPTYGGALRALETKINQKK